MTIPVLKSEAEKKASLWARITDSDLFIDFKNNPLVILATIVTFVFLVGSLLAPWIPPSDSLNPLTLAIMNSSKPTFW